MLHGTAFLLELVGFVSFIYGVAAACEAQVMLGRLQLRGWRAVLGRLGIAAVGMAAFYLVPWCESLLGR
jgi:hypothetical protein